MSSKQHIIVSGYIPERLHLVTINDVVPQIRSEYYFEGNYFTVFTTDNELVHERVHLYDFGPLNLSLLYRYWDKLKTCLEETDKDQMIFHLCTTLNEEKRTNAAFLMASFAIIYLKRTVEDALRPLKCKLLPPFLPFRDASSKKPLFDLTLEDSLKAIHRAQSLGIFDFTDFCRAEYDRFSRGHLGNMNWIVPQKLLAFAEPDESLNETSNSILTSSKKLFDQPPEFFFPYFRHNHVTNVIRLSKKTYDANRFVDGGFRHDDLFFEDGQTPCNEILQKFFEITESAEGAVAVHCKAGLGRTGTLMAAYLMKHYRFDVGEAIAWVRICRPGSIIGIQETWLKRKMSRLWSDGNRYREEKYGDSEHIPTHTIGIYSRKTGTYDVSVESFDRSISELNEELKTVQCTKKSSDQVNDPEITKISVDDTENAQMHETMSGIVKQIYLRNKPGTSLVDDTVISVVTCTPSSSKEDES